MPEDSNQSLVLNDNCKPVTLHQCKSTK